MENLWAVSTITAIGEFDNVGRECLKDSSYFQCGLSPLVALQLCYRFQRQ